MKATHNAKRKSSSLPKEAQGKMDKTRRNMPSMTKTVRHGTHQKPLEA